MAVKRAIRGDNVIYRNSRGESYAVVISAGQGPPPTAPVAAASEAGGTLGAATYVYKNTYVKDGIESAVSAASNNAVIAGSTGSVAVTVAAVAGATSYKIYGRTGGNFLLMNTITAPTVLYTDTNVDTPSGASPANNSNITFRFPYAGHAQLTGILPGITAGTYQKI